MERCPRPLAAAASRDVVAALLALPEPSGDLLGTVGVFLSGMGTLLTAFGAFHYERKRGEQECERRFQAFREGMKIKDESK